MENQRKRIRTLFCRLIKKKKEKKNQLFLWINFVMSIFVFIEVEWVVYKRWINLKYSKYVIEWTERMFWTTQTD